MPDDFARHSQRLRSTKPAGFGRQAQVESKRDEAAGESNAAPVDIRLTDLAHDAQRKPSRGGDHQNHKNDTDHSRLPIPDCYGTDMGADNGELKTHLTAPCAGVHAEAATPGRIHRT